MNVILYCKIKFADVIKTLKRRGFSWIIQVGFDSNHSCLYNRETGDFTRREEGMVITEGRSYTAGLKMKEEDRSPGM